MLFSVAVLIIWGIIPMLMIRIVLSVVSAYLNSYYAGKNMGYSLSWQLAVYFPYVLLSMVSCSVAYFIYGVICTLSPWSGLVFSAVAGCACYFLLNLTFNTMAYKEIRILLFSAHQRGKVE